MINQDQRRRLVLSIARLTDDVLRESYVDGPFLVDLKKGDTLFGVQAPVFIQDDRQLL